MTFIGDVHGNFSKLKHKLDGFINDNKLRNHLFFQVGDFGLFCDDDVKQLFDIDILLFNKQCTLHVIRGNHDNPRYWSNDYISNFTNIHFIKDNSSLNFFDNKIFFVGGSISIDRSHRREGVDYWASEKQTVLKDYKRFSDCNIIVSHNAPDKFRLNKKPISRVFVEKDSKLKPDLKRENKLLTDIYNSIKPKYWIYGHHHEYENNLVGDYTQFICVPELDFITPNFLSGVI